MTPNRSIVNGGRAVDWYTDTCAPVPRQELGTWPARQHAAQSALAGAEGEHVGLHLLHAARTSSDLGAAIGAPEVMTLAALLEAAVDQATLDGDEATAWAVIAADVFAAGLVSDSD